MDKLEQSTTKSMYESVHILDKWINISLRMINAEHKRTPGTSPLSSSKWEKRICYYFIEVTNFPDRETKKLIFNQVTELTSTEIGLKKDIVDDITREAALEAKSTFKIGTPEFRVSPKSPSKSPPITSVEIGKLKFSLPTSIYDRLLETATSQSGTAEETIDMLTRLFLRYKPLGPGTGFFWSMDQRLYEFLSEDVAIPVLEGFASPFNNNLPNFCSAFNEDMKFGSRGSFFDYMAILNTPTRVIANPPYTLMVMNRVADVCIDYIERVPGSECVMMYPNWADSEGVIKLMSHPKCQYRIFTDKQYTVHDFSTDQAIMTPMALIFFVLSSGEPTISIDDMSDQIDRAYKETSTKAAKSPIRLRNPILFEEPTAPVHPNVRMTAAEQVISADWAA
jgi:hypothetical protein